MTRLRSFGMTTLSVLLLALPAAAGSAKAQQQSEADKVKSTLDAFHVALSALDLRQMEELWAHDADVMYIGPRDKGITIGWDAVKRKWEAVFNFWSELKVTTQDGPHIHINNGIAWADSIAGVGGRLKAGASFNGPTFESLVLEKRGDRWLIVSDSTSRVP